jgi:hypothetical protein
MLGLHCTRRQKGKIGFPRAYKARFVGYESSRSHIQGHTSTSERNVSARIQVNPKIKDVTFDEKQKTFILRQCHHQTQISIEALMDKSE